MKVLCRHIRCDRSLIFTPEALELRVSRNSTFYSNMYHNLGGVNFVNEKPENGKLITRRFD